MSQHIIQTIRITPRFCKLSSLISFFLVLFVHYINRNHKDKTYPRERGWLQPYMLTRMLVRSVNLNLESVEYFVDKSERFQIKQRHFKIEKEKDSRIFLPTLSQYPHQQKSFGVLLVYRVLNAGIFIHICSTKNKLFGGDLRKMVLLQKIV